MDRLEARRLLDIACPPNLHPITEAAVRARVEAWDELMRMIDADYSAYVRQRIEEIRAVT